jgi:hypothetical protein
MIMQQDIHATLNQNQSDCVHEQSFFSGTTYYNICTNTQTYVPKGSVDYALEGVVIGLGLVIIVLIGLAVGELIRS